MNSATPQDAMQRRLATLGIPHREIRVYGSQIVVTCASQGAAEKWVHVLAQFARVRRPVKSLDVVKADRHLPNARRTIEVWLVGATV